jgi:Protein of unknown function (DUF2516)
VSLILGPLNGLFALVFFAILVVKVWALIDAIIRPAQSYVATSKQTKVFWVVILVLAAVIPGIGILGLAGLIAAIVYLVDVRPALRDASGGRGRSSGGWRS